MKFKIRHADKIVGFFSLLVLIGLIVLIFAVGAKQNWFAQKNDYYTVFDSGAGVQVGMDITYKGFSIGKVSDINLEGKMVRVDYYILEEYQEYVREGSLLELIVSPIGLGSELIFHPGRGEGYLESGQEIYRTDSEAAKKIIEQKLNYIEESTDSINAILADVDALVNDLDSLVVELDDAVAGKGEGELTLLLKELNAVLANVEILTASLTTEQGLDGLVPRLLGEGLNGDVGKIFSNLDEIMQELNKLIGNMEPQVNGTLTEVNRTLLELNDVLTGVKNNPLIRGGVPDRSQEASATVPLRKTDF